MELARNLITSFSAVELVLAYLAVGWIVSIVMYVCLEIGLKDRNSGRFLLEPRGDDLWVMFFCTLFWPGAIVCLMIVGVYTLVYLLAKKAPFLNPARLLFVYPVRSVFFLAGFRKENASHTWTTRRASKHSAIETDTVEERSND